MLSDLNLSNSTDSSFDELLEEEKAEQSISAFFVLFSFLLAMTLVFSKKLHDHPRIARFLPEAGMILLTGVVFGAILNVFIEEKTAESPPDNLPVHYDDDILFLEEEDPVAESLLLSFSPEVFFLVLLPPIIFNSGYHLRKELFFRHFGPICLLAVVGTTISALFIAMTLQAVYQFLPNNRSFQPRFTELLTFGALLSATDPVTTLAVFQEKRVDPQLFYLVFGESVLNDAVGLVLFNAFQEFVAKTNEDAEEVAVDMSEFITGFLYDSVGSPALGMLSGVITAWLFKWIDMRSTKLLELSLFVLIMYVPFLLAELLDLSGIVTILFTGLAAQVYVAPNLSKSTVENADVLFRLAAHLAETAIFLELGLSVFGLTGSIQIAFIGWTIVACLVARAANVYPIVFFYNKMLRKRREGDDLIPQYDHDLVLQESSEENAASPTPKADAELSNLQQRSPCDYGNDNGLRDTKKDQLNNNDSEEGQKQEGDSPSSSEFSNTRSGDSKRDTGDGFLPYAPQLRLDLKIAMNTAHMLWFSGLRGAVAYACVRSFPDTFGHADEFTMTTMVIVLLSVFGLGSTTECMLNKLNIETDVDENADMENWCKQEGGRRRVVELVVKWENYLYRSVVRGARCQSSAQLCVDDTTSSGGTRAFEASNVGSNNSPVGRLSNTANDFGTTQDTAEQFHDEDAMEDHLDEIELVDPGNQQRRRESVFDYGARDSSWGESAV